MEESEALCTNLGIMVNGQFECFGNIQHLKHKYGKGYSLIIKCKTDLEQDPQQIAYNVNLIERFIQSNIPNALIKGLLRVWEYHEMVQLSHVWCVHIDKQQQTLFYQIIVEEDHDKTSDPFLRANMTTSLSIAKIFALIESNKEALNIETYSLSQTTFEQVFLSFARKQTDPHQVHWSVRFANQTSQNEARFAANRIGNTNRAFDESETISAIVVQDIRV